MKMNRMRVAVVAGLVLAASTAAWAAGMFQGLPIVGGASYCNSFNQPGGPGTPTTCTNPVSAGPPALTGAELVPADTQLSQGQNPQTVYVPIGLLANLSGFPKNYVDNGSINIQQYGTGIITCSTTGGSTQATYGPDRFTCSTNVTSGAGRQQVVTTAALLPAGFANVNKLYRTSGALTQPVCNIQELAANESLALAGKQVTLSIYAAALAGLAADNNSVINGYVIYGTGAAEGLGTMTASPAITPAWTGIASLGGAPTTITATPTRYTLATVTVPTTATEVGIEICFTPTATGAGTTDGFAFTGVQLEVAPSPTSYEFHTASYDLDRAQVRYWQWAETVSGTTVVPGMCQAQSSTVAVCNIPLKHTMAKNPTVTCTVGTMKRQVAGTDTTVSACAAAATTNGVSDTDAVAITTTVASGDTAGFASMLMSGNSTGGGLITAWADF